MIALLLDNETTSLVANRTLKDDKLPEIIDHYSELVDLDDGRVIFSLEYLIKPRQPITDDIVKITGITNDMVKEQPPFKEVSPPIFAAIESAPLVIAHNCHFDQECLDIEALRIPYVIRWPRLLCSVEQTVHLTGKRLSLGNLHEHLFGARFQDAHRAKTDVKALTRCCVELVKRGEL